MHKMIKQTSYQLLKELYEIVLGFVLSLGICFVIWDLFCHLGFVFKL